MCCAGAGCGWSKDPPTPYAYGVAPGWKRQPSLSKPTSWGSYPMASMKAPACFCQLVVAGDGKAVAVRGAARPGQRREVPEEYSVEGLDQVGAGHAGLQQL